MPKHWVQQGGAVNGIVERGEIGVAKATQRQGAKCSRVVRVIGKAMDATRRRCDRILRREGLGLSRYHRDKGPNVLGLWGQWGSRDYQSNWCNKEAL